MASLSERFWAKVHKTETCWEWTGAKGNGYGYIGLGADVGKQDLAHRVAYRMLVGPIPDGLQIDHLCRTRHCVNPAHMELVTIRENVLRGEGITAQNRRKTHCPKGHPYDQENTAISPKGHRACRICGRKKSREAMRRRYGWKARILD